MNAADWPPGVARPFVSLTFVAECFAIERTTSSSAYSTFVFARRRFKVSCTFVPAGVEKTLTRIWRSSFFSRRENSETTPAFSAMTEGASDLNLTIMRPSPAASAKTTPAKKTQEIIAVKSPHRTILCIRYIVSKILQSCAMSFLRP
ncbi:hypothetical protein A3C95_02030 [Candidatus Kaiserbacteria bacterium RIFCSPHIGHO2_02_FULL_56_30]|uniref:Uncharacterized protein n=1 Tax=Candidatus Kaiserbacteria bacterium RIFCSPHIGHO2_02_FULL_56_30 TaxID=1798499 RepID=A0A1F6E2E6_9BACT|nr:MAG: hypothetical protein A3C95_02030 [Candidatus Kaiserbacteria bacterium RIFCSPHIGHO2_02_FULL_56_30]